MFTSFIQLEQKHIFKPRSVKIKASSQICLLLHLFSCQLCFDNQLHIWRTLLVTTMLDLYGQMFSIELAKDLKNIAI